MSVLVSIVLILIVDFVVQEETDLFMEMVGESIKSEMEKPIGYSSFTLPFKLLYS